MKIFYKFFIIVFIVLIIFLLKDDLNSILGDTSSYLNKNIKNQIQKISKKEEINLFNKKADTPGALRIVDDLLNINDKELLKEHIIQITNNQRKLNGNLFSLKENQTLDLSAEKKLNDMFINQYFEHISPLGIGVSELSEQSGYNYILIGENLALGNFKDDEAVVEAWMNSLGHKANILNIHYTEIGVAVGRGQFEGKNVWIAVQHFGTPRSICPNVDEVLAGIIDINQNKINKMENDLSNRLEIIQKGDNQKGISYFEKIDEYNNLINIYNNLIKITKQKIDLYNNQVREFNSCILNNK